MSLGTVGDGGAGFRSGASRAHARGGGWVALDEKEGRIGEEVVKEITKGLSFRTGL